MPYVNIKITNEGATDQQKKKLMEGVTQLLVDVLNKNPSTTIVVIDEVETDNWGIGGVPVTELRKKIKYTYLKSKEPASLLLPIDYQYKRVCNIIYCWICISYLISRLLKLPY